MRRYVRSFGALLRKAVSEYQRDYAHYFAVAMIYYALVSLVPLILLLLAALGLLLRMSDHAIALERQLLGTVEASFGADLRATIEQLLQHLQQGSVLASAVSLIGLLLAASKLFNHLRLTFRAIWKHPPPLICGPVRVAVWVKFRERSIAFVMVLAGGALLLAAVAAIALIHWLGTLLKSLPLLGLPTAWLLALPGSLLLTPLIFALLFKFLPPVQIAWRHVWLASALCAGAWIAGAEILTLYGVFFSKNLGAYGALGAVLVIMLWMNAISQMLFVGAELCKVVATRDAGLDPSIQPSAI